MVLVAQDAMFLNMRLDPILNLRWSVLLKTRLMVKMRWVLEINFVGRPGPIGFSVSNPNPGDMKCPV